jgi:hypothetical protein
LKELRVNAELKQQQPMEVVPDVSEVSGKNSIFDCPDSSYARSPKRKDLNDRASKNSMPVPSLRKHITNIEQIHYDSKRSQGSWGSFAIGDFVQHFRRRENKTFTSCME